MPFGPKDGKQLKVYAQFGAVGIELALSVVIGLLAGQWADGKLGTEPIGTIIGLILGVIAGFRSLIRLARKASSDLSNDSNDDHG